MSGTKFKTISSQYWAHQKRLLQITLQVSYQGKICNLRGDKNSYVQGIQGYIVLVIIESHFIICCQVLHVAFIQHQFDVFVVSANTHYVSVAAFR